MADSAVVQTQHPVANFRGVADSHPLPDVNAVLWYRAVRLERNKFIQLAFHQLLGLNQVKAFEAELPTAAGQEKALKLAVEIVQQNRLRKLWGD